MGTAKSLLFHPDPNKTTKNRPARFLFPKNRGATLLLRSIGPMTAPKLEEPRGSVNGF
jgi:hypothetical protein